MKKGFTLVELLAVIVILGLIALITTPIVTTTINNSEEKAYDKQIDVIENAAKQWGVENTNSLPSIGSNRKKIITLDNLVESGKLENSKVIDPRTNNEMNGCVVVKYNSEYKQYEYNYEENKSKCVVKTICRAVMEDDVTTGNKPSGNYVYGDEYICDPGDGVERRFFVLEDGDNSVLTKGNGTLHYYTASPGIGTAEDGEVALIMNQNIGASSVNWCASGSSNTCNADGAKSYLNSQTSGWTVEVNLPTYAQIKAANNGSTSSLPVWLYDYSANSSNVVSINFLGYWTSTAYSTSYSSSNAWLVYSNGLDWLSVNEESIGVRPVITINKNNISN